jgi:uroporphyrin-III C-methyltransferase / precorrin-2 dehydrogenase / sirohydrochlorin ferrochelatase
MFNYNILDEYPKVILKISVTSFSPTRAQAPLLAQGGMNIFPLSLVILGRTVPVVGRGDLAAAKARSVERAGGLVQLVDPEAAMPAFENLAQIALIADDNAERAGLWTLRLRAMGLLVNVADLPHLCDFLLPAVIDRSPVMVSIATGGASATLARRLREHLEAMLPTSLGVLADAIAAARPDVATRLTTPALRRAFWDDQLKSGGALDPFGLTAPPTPQAISALAEAVPMRPRLSVITLASPDADDLTLRAMRRLQAADLVVTCGDVAARLSDRSRRDARLVCHDLLPEDWTSALDPAERLAVLLLSTPRPKIQLSGWDVEHLDTGKAGL